MTENLENASTNIKQWAYDAFGVSPGLLLHGKMSMNTVAPGWPAGVCGCLFLAVARMVAIWQVTQSVSGSVRMRVSCQTLCLSVAKSVLIALWPRQPWSNERFVYFIWFSPLRMTGQSGMRRGACVILLRGCKGRRTIRMLLAILMPVMRNCYRAGLWTKE